MTSNPPASCCFTGFKHEGAPGGKIITIGENASAVSAYIARPKCSDSAAETTKAILIFSDVFGIFTNIQLLADDFAANGYLTIVPDLFRGDKMDVGDFEAGKIDIPEWISRNDTQHIDPVVELTIKYLKDDLGVKRIAGAGYCFGGKYLIRFLKDRKIDVGFTAHPSFVSDEELASIQKPLSIAAAGTDQIFTHELRHKSEDILYKTGQRFQLNLFSDVEHGFAVRADLSKSHNRYAKEQAFLLALAWMKNLL